MPANVPQIVAEWMRPFAPCFTAAVWRHALVLVIGTLLVPGRRTVTAALRVMGLGHTSSFALFIASSARDAGPLAPLHTAFCSCSWPPSCRMDRS